MTDQVVPEPWHIPRALSNEALRLLTSLPLDEIERRLRMDGPTVPEGREPAAVDGQPSDGEVVELTDEALYLIRELRDQADDLSPSLELFGLLHNAADLLDRAVLARWSSQTTPVPVARLPENAQVIEPANHTILAPIPTPIPVCERLPEKAEMTDDDEVWVEYPGGEYPLGDTGDYDWEPHKWILSPIEKSTIRENRRWLPAHALPLPEVE